MNNDLSESLRTFEKQLKEKNNSSGKGLLLKALMKIDDQKNLQRFLDLMDRETALLSALHSFMEDGKINEARAIIKKNVCDIID